MKKPDEIKKGLNACKRDGDCDRGNCPYHSMGGGTKCIPAMSADALAYIQQLEAELQKERLMHQHTYEHAELFKEERDAAVKDLKNLSACSDRYSCTYCKYREPNNQCNHECYPYTESWGWEWRGVKEDEK